MIAVVSDIHGNFPALQAVFKDIKNNGCNKIISLGDIAGYYCMINECIELCREENVINILGNHDYYLISGKGCPRSYSANLCLEYQANCIKKENFEWLKKSVSIWDSHQISLRHGGWHDSLDEYIYEFSFKMVEGRKEKLYGSGHTHIQSMLCENEKVYFNPGAVGQPRDYDSRAAYAIIKDNLQIELKRVEYPIDKIIYEMNRKGFPSRISSCLLKGSKIGEFEQ